MADQYPTQDEICREVDTTLTLVDADRINLAFTLLRVMEKAASGDRPAVLRHIAASWDSAASNKEYKLDPIITEFQLRELEDRYAIIVDRLLQLLLDHKPPPDEFYEKLYETIKNPAFDSEEARAFALFWILIDKRIPYFELERGMRVSSEDWRALGAKIETEQTKVRFIMASTFDQRSERADLVLRELDRLEGPERVRLMANVLADLERLEDVTNKVIDRLSRR